MSFDYSIPNKPKRRQVDYNSIRQELRGTGAYYADPDFPPAAHSLYFSGRIPNHLGPIVWKRPKDLYRNPIFISQGATRHDVNQGELGNCWFIAAAANLALGNRKLFERVVPQDQDFDHNYAGVFRFNFWWYGKWTEVVVDDYLPTDGRNLIYGQNRERPNEFWPALLEKAYAKLRGCYQGLDGGKLQDALVDMTGGISEIIKIEDKSSVPADLYTMLKQSHQMKSLLGACIYRPKDSTDLEVEMANGLYMGHAYSINKFQELKSNRGIIQLLRLRNPWGRGEWKGAWADNSQEIGYLPENIKKEMEIEKKEEGEFWISYQDFIRNFDEIQLCHLQVDAMVEELEDNSIKQNWNVTVYHDEWIRGVTAGGCGNPPNIRLYWKNPQFRVELKKPDTINTQGGDCTLIVSLMEKEQDNRTKVAIGFDIYKLKNADNRPLNETRAPSNALLLAKRSGKYAFYREVTKRFELPPGIYVIIASTFHPHEEAKFMLRIFTENFAESGVMEDEEEEPTESDIPAVATPKDIVADTFAKYCGSDNRLDAAELQKFLAAVSEQDINQRLNFNLEQCRSLIPMVDESNSGRLEMNEAKRAWKEMKAYRDVFVQFDKDGSNSVDTFELTTMFNKLGGPFLMLLKEMSTVGSYGFPVNRSILTAIVRRYGDRDNRISLEDFIVIIFKLIQLFNVYTKQEGRTEERGVATFSRNEFLQSTMYL